MNSPLRTFILGTRGSHLALIQAEYIRDRLTACGPCKIEIKVIHTRGDRETSLPFNRMTGQGFFTKELEAALLAGEIDLAVHSGKDLETTRPDGLHLAAVPQRADRRDMIVARDPGYESGLRWGLAEGAIVGSSSARRIAQLSFYRPDLRIKALRGNVPTRVEKLRAGEYDAIVLAVAGVRRLNLSLEELQVVELSDHEFIPAPAQGALAVETRVADREVTELVRLIDDTASREMVEAERAVLKKVGGGCQLPLGVCADRRGESIALAAFLGARENSPSEKPRRVCVAAGSITGAVDAVVGTLTRPVNADSSSAFCRRRFVITRPAEQVTGISATVVAAGGELICYPALQVVAAGDADQQQRALAGLPGYDWLFFSSGNGIRMFFAVLNPEGKPQEIANRVAVMGPGSAAVFAELAGRAPDFVPAVSTGEGFAQEFITRHGRPGARILFPTTAERRGELERTLQEAGMVIEPLVVYNTVQPETGPVWDGRADAVILTSPKAARHFLAMAAIPAGAGVVSIGPSTTDYLIKRGVSPVNEALTHDLAGVLEALYVHFG
jgi:hydroxymethylbilane synthase